MAEPCQSYAHKYVGKGVDRVLFEGQCALDRGHDMDCLPLSLAHKQMTDAVYNSAITEAKNALLALGNDGMLDICASDVETTLDKLMR